MAYKNIEDRKNYAKEHYKRNSALYKARARISTKKARKGLREFLNNLQSLPCMDCKKIFPPECMDFDHRDGNIKKYNISDARKYGYSIERIKEEIAKCDIVCACCHRIRTKRRRAGGIGIHVSLKN